LEDSFSPKSPFLAFRKNTESLLEMLLVVVGHLGLARIDDRVETTRQTTEINPSVFREKKGKNPSENPREKTLG
jgi:hypothetical protein